MEQLDTGWFKSHRHDSHPESFLVCVWTMDTHTHTPHCCAVLSIFACDVGSYVWYDIIKMICLIIKLALVQAQQSKWPICCTVCLKTAQFDTPFCIQAINISSYFTSIFHYHIAKYIIDFWRSICIYSWIHLCMDWNVGLLHFFLLAL